MEELDTTAANLRCFVALGGNVKNVAETFESALSELATSTGRHENRPRQPVIRLGRISTNFATPAVGPQAGGGFLNAAAELFTALSPLELLGRLQQVEASHGRDRTGIGPARSPAPAEWGPRTLDLDLILYGDRVIDAPELQVPHPACWYRRFVLDPLAEIAAEVIHPVKRASFGELRSRLLPRPLTAAFAGGTSDQRSELADRLREEFPPATFDADWSPGIELPALLFWMGMGSGRSDDATFETLPLLPRLDASAVPDLLAFLRSVLQAALGE
jgi:2-amino-4-hydroxy-6-hydroxymethyldihydropteridine diphosphokinase